MRLFTSESVSMGHPDKVADQISDAILDAMLEQDPHSRVAVETLVSTGMAVVAGEVTTEAYVDIAKIVRETVREIGYTDPAMAFDADACAVMSCINQQSPDIAMGVDTGGAGDQGMMFGYACRETQAIDPDAYMPLPVYLSHRLVERQAQSRRAGDVSGLRPDAKAQVTMEYDDAGKPARVDTVVLSTQHDAQWNEKQAELRSAVIDEIIKPVLGGYWNGDVNVHVNPTGRFEIGGPHGDAGLTGRKIIVDTYGGAGRHGGGAFSGKDATKVDRSAAYMARYIAKNVVAADLADVCEVQLSYAIGVIEPTSVLVDCQGTAKTNEAAIARAVRNVFRMTPKGIIDALELRKPIYRETACHGHFGRQADAPAKGCFSWERIDKAGALREAALGKEEARAGA